MMSIVFDILVFLILFEISVIGGLLLVKFYFPEKYDFENDPLQFWVDFFQSLKSRFKN